MLLRFLRIAIVVGVAVWGVAWLRKPEIPCPVTEGQIVSRIEQGKLARYRVENVRWYPSLRLFDESAEGQWRWDEEPVGSD